MSGYIGTTPVPQATQHREAFTANANQTTFATAGYTVGYIDVWVNGVKLAAADVTVTNGSDIVLASAAAANDIVEYLAFVPFEATNQTFTGATVINSLNLNGDGATVTGIKDEDNMASNDANKLATQQSIKAYVDSTVAATNEVVEDTTPQLGGDLASNGNDILMADNDKVILGAGSDLQLYHDGTHSYISDTGTGYLNIKTSDRFAVQSATGETMIEADANGTTKLYYDNSKKLETTSAGINVTGSVTADGLTVDGGGSRQYINSGHLRLSDDYNLEWGGGTNYIRGSNSSGAMSLVSTGNLTLDVAGDIILDADGGDVLLKDGGTHFGSIYTTSTPSHMYIQSIISGQSLILATVGGVALTIDSSKNVGIGTTSPTTSYQKVLHIHEASGSSAIHLTNNTTGSAAGDGTDLIAYLSDFYIWNREAGNLIFGTAATERMRINSTGNVGIGTTSIDGTLHLDAGTSSDLIIEKDATGSAAVRFHNAGSQTSYISLDADENMTHYGGSGVDQIFYAGAAERMRIDGSGNVHVRCTDTPSASVSGFLFTSDQLYTSAGNTTNTNTQVRFYNGNGLVGSISTAGSGTAYATSSDYRLKENVTYTWDATTRLKQLKPARFNWIADSDNTIQDGFLAHEVSSIVPEAVFGTKDAEIQENGDGYQSLDYSKLVPLLVKTILELEARITTLEG